jgi:hypothetical protein
VRGPTLEWLLSARTSITSAALPNCGAGKFEIIVAIGRPKSALAIACRAPHGQRRAARSGASATPRRADF